MVCVREQVGLAVDDIKGVQEQAALKRMAMQVNLLSSQFTTEACRVTGFQLVEINMSCYFVVVLYVWLVV